MFQRAVAALFQARQDWARILTFINRLYKSIHKIRVRRVLRTEIPLCLRPQKLGVINTEPLPNSRLLLENALIIRFFILENAVLLTCKWVPNSLASHYKKIVNYR